MPIIAASAALIVALAAVVVAARFRRRRVVRDEDEFPVELQPPVVRRRIGLAHRATQPPTYIQPTDQVVPLGTRERTLDHRGPEQEPDIALRGRGRRERSAHERDLNL